MRASNLQRVYMMMTFTKRWKILLESLCPDCGAIVLV